MTEGAGVWIDHRKAHIAELTPDGDRTTILFSKEKYLERGGDSPLKGAYDAHQVPANDSRQRALTGELNVYYDAVITALRSHNHLLLFGPGEAKGELQKRLVQEKLGALVEAVETEDKMTDHQIVAKVRGHFGDAAPRVQHTS